MTVVNDTDVLFYFCILCSGKYYISVNGLVDKIGNDILVALPGSYIFISQQMKNQYFLHCDRK